MSTWHLIRVDLPVPRRNDVANDEQSSGNDTGAHRLSEGNRVMARVACGQGAVKCPTVQLKAWYEPRGGGM
jgi:hypothetical protein